MAYQCRLTGGECDGCGTCNRPVLYSTAYNGQPIYCGDRFYDFDGELVLEEDLKEWAEKYLKEAEKGQY